MKGRRLVKEGFLSLETIETWIVYSGAKKYLVSHQLCKLTQLWEILRVNMGQHPCGKLSTPCSVHALTNVGCSEAKRGCHSILGKCF
jgi:hypothetical protein